MVRKLKIIFGLDAVALHLRVARERLVFLKQLGGIAARAVVLAVARIGRLVRRTRSAAAAAATAAVLTIVDQMKILVLVVLFCHSGRAPPGRSILHDPGQGPHARPPPPHAASVLRRSKQSGVGDGRPHASFAVVGPVPAPYVAMTAAKSKRKR